MDNEDLNMSPEELMNRIGQYAFIEDKEPSNSFITAQEAREITIDTSYNILREIDKTIMKESSLGKQKAKYDIAGLKLNLKKEISEDLLRRGFKVKEDTEKEFLIIS